MIAAGCSRKYPSRCSSVYAASAGLHSDTSVWTHHWAHHASHACDHASQAPPPPISATVAGRAQGRHNSTRAQPQTQGGQINRRRGGVARVDGGAAGCVCVREGARGSQPAQTYLYPFAKDVVGDTEGGQQVEEGMANREEWMEQRERRYRVRPAARCHQHLPPAVPPPPIKFNKRVSHPPPEVS